MMHSKTCTPRRMACRYAARSGLRFFPLGPLPLGVWWMIAALLAPSPALAAGEHKIAMTALRAGEGATDKLAASLSDAVVAEVRRGGRTIITHDEVATILGHEAQKQLLSCDDASCYADLSGALGADELMTGSVAKLGTSWVVHLQRIDLGSVKVVAQADRRLKDASLDDLLDALPGLTQEVVSAVPKSGEPTSTALPRGDGQKPSPRAELPLEDLEETKGLTLFKKGKHYLALNLSQKNRSPVFFGDGKRFFKQHTAGSGRNGENFSITIWDPRYRDGYMRGVDHKDGVTTARCGDDQPPLEPLSKSAQDKILRAAKFFRPAWTRAAVAIASDDQGGYIVVDQAREPRSNTDFRLYAGTRGAFSYLPVTDYTRSDRKEVFLTAKGQLVLDTNPNGKAIAYWTSGAARRELTPLSIFEAAPRVYGELGVYDGAPLGTFCDPLHPSNPGQR